MSETKKRENKEEEDNHSSQWRAWILLFIWLPCLIAQLVLVLFLGCFNRAGLVVLMFAGWGVWAISVVLGILPIIVLKRRGGVEKGKSYVHTRKLVTSGLYSIVRHPQYTAGILLSLALVLIGQHWLVLVLGLIAMPAIYIDIMMADRHEIKKFGDDYREYMKRVPRTNFLWGIVKLLIGGRKR